MKKALLILALPLILLASMQADAGDVAMTAAAPKTRAEMREEVKAAVRSGELQQAGEAGPAALINRNVPVGTITRLQVKQETKAAAKAGALPKTGENFGVDTIDRRSTSTKSRAEVKAETRAAANNKAIVTGENSYAGN